MPELPEVQTIINELKEIIIHKNIEKIRSFRDGTIVSNGIDVPFGSEIIAIERLGKYIVINLDNTVSLIIHLRMTGKLIFESSFDLPLKHDRAIIYFVDGSMIRFNDIRTFGKIEYILTNSLGEYFSKMGLEPFSTDFNEYNLLNLMEKSRKPIKSFLLDQNKIAGLGNIYVCEILYRVGIRPQTITNTITKSRVKDIIFHTKEVLEEAIACNGTTISDYRRVDNKSGTFQNFLKVYGKSECPRGHKIVNERICGRSSYYCSECQK